MSVLRFTVPGEPRAWARARTGGKSFFMDARTRSEKQAVASWAIEAGATLIEGPICLTIHAFMSIPKSASKKRRAAMLAGDERPTKRPDGDNIAKLTMDALNSVCWHDDAQVVDLIVRKRWSDRARIEIEISPVMAITEQSAGSLQNRVADAA